ncbi:MAG: histidine kinase dimerization/phospho-acceptor domain-containing protein, partial [bacterium]
MTRPGARATSLGKSLGRVRLRLTAWYVGTFVAIFALLGFGLFATITARFDHDLDASLREATREVARVARARAGPSATALLLDSANDLRIPGRVLYLLDSAGNPANGAAVDPWIQAVARDAWRNRSAAATFNAHHERILRAHADGFTLANGRSLVAIAVADEIELEDRYAALIAVFSAVAFVAIVLVAVGGWFLTRQSTAPIEQAFAHMRRFMADAAHELRTPLTVVRSRAEVALQRPRDGDEYIRALRGIEQDAARLGRIVEDLLILVRADAGERPIERKRVFLDDITLDAAEAAHIIAERRGVRLEVGAFEETAVLGDAELLRRLVMILLDNAIKFTPASGVVRVGIVATGPTATLTVSDTGAGIPA